MPHRYDDTLQDLLPVRLQKGLPGATPRRCRRSGWSWPRRGIHEAMRFYDEPGRNQNAWANLPRYYWAPPPSGLPPGATVLCWNPIETAYGKVPLIAHHYAGQGRVLFVGTDETFRWRQNVGERFFYRFWGQATRFVARRDAKAARRAGSRSARAAQPGEQAEIELMAFGHDGVARRAEAGVQVTGGGRCRRSS